MYVARLLSAAGSVNNTLVCPTASKIFAIYCVVPAAAGKFLKIYNKNTAPAAGTDTPIATFYLAPTGVVGGVNKFEMSGSPIICPAGFGFAITGAAADNDTTALTAADVQALNIVYSA